MRGPEELFLEALPIERELYPNDTQLARTLGGLASLAMREGQAEKAIPLAEEALAITVQSEGENSLDAALAYANIAEAHRVLGRNDRALPLFRKSRATYERILGTDHPRVSSVLTQEGLLLLQEGKLGMAEEALDRSLGDRGTVVSQVRLRARRGGEQPGAAADPAGQDSRRLIAVEQRARAAGEGAGDAEVGDGGDAAVAGGSPAAGKAFEDAERLNRRAACCCRIARPGASVPRMRSSRSVSR